MGTDNIIHIVTCHAEGEVGDVIVSGVDAPPGDSTWEQSRWIAKDDALRQLVLNEPRGGVFRHVNLLVPPKHPDADAAFIIMEPADTPPMSGSNAMCVSTVILETGIVEMKEPSTELTLEAPGGLVKVDASCAAGKVKSVKIRNVPSFACGIDQHLDVPGLGLLKVDTAYGGDSFVVVNATSLGFDLAPREARDLAELGVRITEAATEQLGFTHPENPDWKHISFCLFGTPAIRSGDILETRHAVAIRPGKIDRSPTGTGVSARLALLHARQAIAPGEVPRARSIIDSEFSGRIEAETFVGEMPAVVPSIEGRAWRTGSRDVYVDPGDPWPQGYRVSDTWPAEQ